MAERWEQWRRDFAEFGHIRFIEQTFDDFPEGSDGYGGGFGDFCHRPDLRSCPGYWEVFGDGSDARPYPQGRVRHGASGRALKLTREARAGRISLCDTTAATIAARILFLAIRRSAAGRAGLISGCTADARSAFVAYLQYDFDPADRANVGLYVTDGEPGAVYFRQAGKFAASPATMAAGRWHRVTLLVDLERKVYSAEIAADGGAAQPVCRDVPYATVYNAFNRIEFSPQGAAGSELFLDSVSLHWTPAVMPGPHGRRIIAQDGFNPRCPARASTAS